MTPGEASRVLILCRINITVLTKLYRIILATVFPKKKMKIRHIQQRKVTSKEIKTTQETLLFLSELCPIEPLAKRVYKDIKTIILYYGYNNYPYL